MTRLPRWEGREVAAWARRWDVPVLEVHDRVGSTNDRARELARSGSPPWTVVLAEEQTRGRGRGGDAWHSPPGSGLWMSAVVPVSSAGASCLPLLVGLAAARAVEAEAEVPVGVKWPNDLLVADRKVGGILCEGAGSVVVVGVGINVRAPEGGFPEALREVAGSLEEEAGRTVSREGVAGRLLAGLRALDARSVGVDELTGGEVAELARRDVLAGRRVVTSAGEGIGAGVDRRGGLRLEGPDGGVTTVVAGSVRLIRGDGIPGTPAGSP